MAFWYVLLLPRWSYILPLLMLWTEKQQHCNTVNLHIPNAIALHYLSHQMIHSLLHHLLLIEVSIYVIQSKYLIFSDTELQSWQVIDEVLSNADHYGGHHLQTVYVRWLSPGEKSSTQHPCIHNVLAKILPRCSEKGMVKSECLKIGCETHDPL